MAGTLRLSNTGTGNGQSTITTAASGDTTYTLPSGGGTFVTTSSTEALTVPFASGTVNAPSITFLGDSNTGIYSPAADTIAFTEGGSEALRIDSSGRVGVGTTTPSVNLVVQDATNARTDVVTTGGATARISSNSTTAFVATTTNHPLAFAVNNGEVGRFDTSGRLLVGTSGASAISKFIVQGYVGGSDGFMSVRRGAAGADNQRIGAILFDDSSENVAARIDAYGDGVWGTNDYPGRLVFSTTADGASSPTERMRIQNDGHVVIGKAGQTISYQNPGINLFSNGSADFTRASAYLISVNRKTDDGVLVEFYQDNNLEGTISVSGTTVSYNGAHLSRWSQLPSGAERTEILRGSVLSNIDEMCEWTDEENEQLNRMKVSDVEGDRNVSGVFQAWDDDDDTYTNDFYCAMTGDFIIRIAAGVTVERGDLLMSAGDGTAKPQGDDIIRSKTIAKVTSTNVSCTYPDGSYCVPCVLMAC